MTHPNQNFPKSIVAAVKGDFLPSIVVFLVALPLCLGIAIASGAPPAAGLITGIIGGIIVGALAGSPLQVSGPAAGLTVIVYDLIQRYGFEAFLIIVVVAGLMQLAAGLMKMGQWFRAVSPAVIQGMLAGIGVLIFSSQFHIMVDDSPRESVTLFGLEITGGLANLLTLPEAVWKAIYPLDGSAHQWAALMGVLTISIIVGWKVFAPKKMKLIPGPLLGVVLATLLVVIFGFDIRLLGERMPESLAAGMTFIEWGDWGTLTLGTLLAAAAGLALVASAETLLCATAVDQMQQGPRTNYDRELAAQGVGNTLCGLVGGLPMTGVIVRSSANVEAGAKTRSSAIMHGMWLLVFVALLPMVLEVIPIASLAAVLVYTGYKLVNVQAIRTLLRFGKGEVMVYVVTMGTIVVKDLLTGVIVGIVVAAVKLLYTFSHLEIRMDREGNMTTMYLNGTATFFRLPKLAAALEQVPVNTELHVHFENLDYIDHACLDLLMNWEKQHKATGGSLSIDWNSLATRVNSPAGNGNHNGATNNGQSPSPRRKRAAAEAKVK